ncbi:hypothetical protein FNF27_02368 [Cafeteria roenbergensis]|uniref:Glyoxylate reductase n=1 Tax=Cafeteria roenbergensis TaxID=33653 RepID=A0A5A8DRT2_CAFRO|nr:hypothetical protein FNF31_00644 [Cafeteria roenbergensis]KAA0169351.1 hypothetical protein FNF28_02132 [Cafeteria roenbergensis]KAA0176312.1 hypothetical protein FNF27_02368 [Cafeteria roenbergensis]
MAASGTSRVLVVQDAAFPAELQAAVDARFRSVISPGFAPPPGLPEPAQVLLSASHDAVTGDVLDAFGGTIKVVSNFGVGYDHIDEAACTERGVLLGNTPNVLTAATAEMALALLLAHARRVVEGDARSRDPSLTRIDTSWMSKQVAGSTVGIVGLGRIGHAVATRCLAFGASIAYHQRHRAPPDQEASLGDAAWCETLHALLASSDFVVLCCSCTAETRGLISSAQLSCMRPGAVLVNIGRGALVDQEAVALALERGALGGYATDVTDPEPLPEGHALLRAPRCIITPHTGSATVRTRKAMLDLALANIAAALAGSTMPASPNQDALASKTA